MRKNAAGDNFCRHPTMTSTRNFLFLISPRFYIKIDVVKFLYMYASCFTASRLDRKSGLLISFRVKKAGLPRTNSTKSILVLEKISLFSVFNFIANLIRDFFYPGLPKMRQSCMMHLNIKKMENRYRIINLHILSQYQYNLIASHFNSFDIIESSSYMLNFS